MKNLKWICVLSVIFCLFSSCEKDNDAIIPDDLRQMFRIPGRSIGTAIKSVPREGTTEWRFNAVLWKNPSTERYIVEFRTGSPYYYYVENIWVSRETVRIYFQDNMPLIKDYSANLVAGAGLNSTIGQIRVFYFRHLADGDVLGGIWNLDASQNNQFRITGIDRKNNICTGEFEFYFVRDETTGPDSVNKEDDLQFARRINFLKGKFTAKIID